MKTAGNRGIGVWVWALGVTLSLSCSVSQAQEIQDQDETVVEASPLKPAVPDGAPSVVGSDEDDSGDEGFEGLSGTVVGSGVGGLGSGAGDGGVGAYDSGQVVIDESDFVEPSEGSYGSDSTGAGAVAPVGTPVKADEPVPYRVTKELPSQYFVKSQVYVSALGGVAATPALENASSLGGAGLALGVLFNDNFSVEGSAVYSRQQTSHEFCPSGDPACGFGSAQAVPSQNLIDQFMFGLGAHYHFFFGQKLVPFLGGRAQYSLRGHMSQSTDDQERSQAFDAGPSLGLDFRWNEHWSLGASWTYFFNINHGITGTPRSAGSDLVEVSASNLAQFESVDYQMILGTLKYTF